MGESNASEQRPEHRLSLDNVLADLVADGLIGRGAAQGLQRTLSQRDRAERHPLELVADAKLHHAESPRRILTLEELTYWLARKSGLDYLRIDPLKIDAPKVGGLVTAAYAAWNRILPVSITAERAVFATS
mgnify:CR=1 FL=1